jgi:glycosyltransferase involved in cell wall biosynthesis
VNNYPLQDELSQLSSLDWNKRENSVGYVGGISEERGIHEMLAAIQLLPRHLGVKLELAGPLSPELYRELAAGPLWRHVKWNRTLDRTGVSSLLGRVRAGLVVTHPEPNLLVSQPVKLFEYMAAGIPVIASDFPQWRSTVEHFQCCLFVDPLDPNAIARAIERLLNHPAEAEAMGKRGREAVEARFQWSAEEKTLLSFYSSLLDDVEVSVFEGPVIQPSREAQ